MPRLHIIGPGFGCASIDAQCNAAVALLKLWSERTGGEWSLVISREGFDRLPLLREDDGQEYVGFGTIARHLRLRKQQARVSAAEAFVESTGQLLVDVSHYISYENYSDRTQRAFTRVLPWYANYFIPPQRRAAARARTNHLGLSSMDVDDVHDSVLDRPQEQSMAEKRQEQEMDKRSRTLLGRNRTLKAMLRQPTHSGAFRLKALADSFYEPLQDLLESQEFFGGNEPEVEDCLAYGYLSLLLLPKMVHPWARDIMQQQYEKLANYVERVHSKLGLGVRDADVDQIYAQAAGSTLSTQCALPWTAAEPVQLANKLTSCANAVARHMPFATEHDPISKRSQPMVLTGLDLIHRAALGSVLTIGLSVFVAVRLGHWPRGQDIQIFGRKRLSDYGAAGAALSVLGTL